MTLKEILKFKLFALMNAPMIGFAGTKVLQVTEDEAVVKVPLNFRTKRRDLNSMYLGALVVGADVASGVMAFFQTLSSPHKFSIVFKSIHSEFLKRAESDALFTCSCGKQISELLQKAVATKERQSMEVPVTATCPKTSGNEPVAKFVLVLTVKVKS